MPTHPRYRLLAIVAIASATTASCANESSTSTTAAQAAPSSTAASVQTTAESTTAAAPATTAAAATTSSKPAPTTTIAVPTTELVLTVNGLEPIAPMTNGPLPALPTGAVTREVDFEGHTIFSIEIPGEGPPIVLMHGFPDNLHLYDNLYPLLTGRRVIAFDFVGWGRSDNPGRASSNTTR